MAAVRNWQFAPQELDGQKIPSRSIVPISFDNPAVVSTLHVDIAPEGDYGPVPLDRQPPPTDARFRPNPTGLAWINPAEAMVD